MQYETTNFSPISIYDIGSISPVFFLPLLQGVDARAAVDTN